MTKDNPSQRGARRQHLAFRLCQMWIEQHRPDVYGEIRAEVDRQIPKLKMTLRLALPKTLVNMK